MEWLVAAAGVAIAAGAVLVLIVGAGTQRRTWEELDGLARALERRRKGRLPRAGWSSDPALPGEGLAADAGAGLDREVRSVGAYARKRPADAASVIRLMSGRPRGGP